MSNNPYLIWLKPLKSPVDTTMAQYTLLLMPSDLGKVQQLIASKSSTHIEVVFQLLPEKLRSLADLIFDWLLDTNYTESTSWCKHGL